MAADLFLWLFLCSALQNKYDKKQQNLKVRWKMENGENGRDVDVDAEPTKNRVCNLLMEIQLN